MSGTVTLTASDAAGTTPETLYTGVTAASSGATMTAIGGTTDLLTLTGGTFTSTVDVNVDTTADITKTVTIGSGNSAIAFGVAGTRAAGAYSSSGDVTLTAGQVSLGKNVTTKTVNGFTYTDAADATALTFVYKPGVGAYLTSGSVKGAT